MSNFVLTFIVLFASSLSAFADSEAMQTMRLTKPANGSCYFKMVPQVLDNDKNDEVYMKEEPYGAAYEQDGNGNLKELWKVSGWYSFEFFVSSDCRYLVRMGNWSRGQVPEKDDLAVAFYDNGDLISSYSTADLITNKDSVRQSISHYQWRLRGDGYPVMYDDTHFHIKTIESKIFIFDIKTGTMRDAL